MKIYRVFLSASGRRRNPVRHIGEAERGIRGMWSRFGTALCGVHTNSYPENGDMGKVENATCKRCLAKWRAIPPLEKSEGR
jgi:hypothetical protein